MDETTIVTEFCDTLNIKLLDKLSPETQNFFYVMSKLALKKSVAQKYRRVATTVIQYFLVNEYNLLSYINLIPGVINYEIIATPGFEVNSNALTLKRNDVTEDCKIGPQSIHVMYLNTKAKDYQFVNVCCDKTQYKTLEKYDKGVVINSTFFDLTSYKPIGRWKGLSGEKVVTENNKIPDGFSQYYRTVGISPHKISFYGVKDKIPGDMDYMTCGPMLIENGRPVLDQSDASKFMCGNPSGDYVTFKRDKKGNCDLIDAKTKKPPVNCVDGGALKPGQLYHGDNPNPRSMLLTRNNSDGKGDVAFVVVEGRQPGAAVGYDFKNLLKLAQHLGATNAINLDGGSSTSISYKLGPKVKNIPGKQTGETMLLFAKK